MSNIRAFVAVLMAEDLKKNIAKVQQSVKKLAPDVKWVAPENLHVTLKFLGDVLEDALPDVFAAVEQAARSISPFELSVSGLGAFPSPARARVVWVGVERGVEELRALASEVDTNLAELDFEKEEKEFRAHITIGRVRDGAHLGKLAEGIREIDASGLGVQRVSSIAVMRSDLRPDGPVYSPLRVAELS